MAKEPKLLPRKQWYTLDQAIEKLSKENVGDFSRNDLVHYWINELIEFHTTIFYNIETLQLGNIIVNNDELISFELGLTESDLDKFKTKGLPVFENDIIMLAFYSKEIMEIGSLFHQKKNKNESNSEIKKLNLDNKSLIILEGLIRIPRPVRLIDKIKISTDIKLGKNCFLYLDFNGETIIDFETNENNSLLLDEIYLTQENLQKIYDLQQEGKINNKLQSRKSQNTQARFIRDLLAANYGLKTAQEIRWALDDSRSKISRQFDEKGLTKPSGKTIYNYINQIED